MKEVFTAKEFSEIMGISERTAKRWIREEKIKTFKLGRLRRISADEIERIKKEGVR